jgi:hypothetical protein
VSDWSRWRANLRHHLCLQEARSIRHDFRKHTCGPSSFASVEIAFEPSNSFTFVRSCEWPNHLSVAEITGLDDAMAAGVHDALQPSGAGPYEADGVAARCVAVEYDDVGSSQVAFYTAAWRATRELRETAAWELREKP